MLETAMGNCLKKSQASYLPSTISEQIDVYAVPNKGKHFTNNVYDDCLPISTVGDVSDDTPTYENYDTSLPPPPESCDIPELTEQEEKDGVLIPNDLYESGDDYKQDETQIADTPFIDSLKRALEKRRGVLPLGLDSPSRRDGYTITMSDAVSDTTLSLEFINQERRVGECLRVGVGSSMYSLLNRIRTSCLTEDPAIPIYTYPSSEGSGLFGSRDRFHGITLVFGNSVKSDTFNRGRRDYPEHSFINDDNNPFSGRYTYWAFYPNVLYWEVSRPLADGRLSILLYPTVDQTREILETANSDYPITGDMLHMRSTSIVRETRTSANLSNMEETVLSHMLYEIGRALYQPVWSFGRRTLPTLITAIAITPLHIKGERTFSYTGEQEDLDYFSD